MSSKYWDDFDRRVNEAVYCIKNNKQIPVRRVAVFVTDLCNFKCSYCNVLQKQQGLTAQQLDNIVNKYGESAIIHITGGEPSIVNWLYDYIESKNDVRFHLNTNAYIKPPMNLKRLKVSLDSLNGKYFNDIVRKKEAFERVVKNIKEASKRVITSVTYTLTKENYKQAPMFMRWSRNEFPELYAVFFSVYKGSQKRFAFTKEDAKIFFDEIKPKLEQEMDKESLELLLETIDEKIRIIQGIRFPENKLNSPCYISMSEVVFGSDGTQRNCSLLYRDGINHFDNNKHDKCLYGCNRRLIAFNKEVNNKLASSSRIFPKI